jgi:hypothetical protein
MTTVKITYEMREAINDFVGKEVLKGHPEISAELFHGLSGKDAAVVFEHIDEYGENETTMLRHYENNFLN